MYLYMYRVVSNAATQTVHKLNFRYERLECCAHSDETYCMTTTGRNDEKKKCHSPVKALMFKLNPPQGIRCGLARSKVNQKKKKNVQPRT